MGKGGAAQQQVTDYYLSLHLGVATECDSVTGIYVDSKTLWEGDASAPTVLPINLPNLNGGPTAEGGAVGNIYVLPGRSDQVLPDDIAGRMNNGQPGSATPGFRGTTTLFFCGTAATTSLVGLLGEAFTNSMPFRGFKWGSNNPIVAQNLSARVKRAPKGLDPSIAMMTATVEVVTITHVDSDNNTTKSQYIAGTDASSIQAFDGDTTTTSSMVVNIANPAHIIFEAMTNKVWGMGAPTAQFDMGVWGSAAQQLYNEGLGLSLMWAKQSSIQDFVNSVLDHVQGVVFVDPSTGLWNLKLIRGDYDVNTLDVYDPSNATLKDYSQKAWGETINEIAVNWTNPLNEGTETVTIQDLANIAIQGGPVTDTRDYPGVRTAALATQLAARDCRSAAAPLRSATLAVDRSAWSKRPGDCIIWNWPEKRVSGAVMRIIDIDRGKKGSPSITLTLLEDIFSLDHAALTPAPGSAWVDPTEAPSPIDNASIMTLPAFFSLTADFQSGQYDLDYPEVHAMVLGYKQSAEVNDYNLYTPQTDSTGATNYTLAGTKSNVERSVLATDLAAEGGSLISSKIIGYPNRGPIATGFVFIGNSDSDYEIALVSDTSGGHVSLQRGVLDTVPKAWPAGTPIWFTNIGQRLVDEAVIRSAGETVSYKLCPRTNIGALAPSAAAVFSQTLTARPHMPLRPANVKVNGHGFGDVAIGAESTISITWATRNRTLEDGQVLLWTDGPVAPEYRQGTVVTVRDQDGNQVYQQAGLWTEDDLSLPAAWFARYSAISITVSSRRDDLDSLQGHTLHVTGLPANPSAALPPDPPPLTDPPSPAAPPSAEAWGVFGTSISAGDGSTMIPAIQVAGIPDVAAAEDLIIQYRVHGSSDPWSTWPLVPLNNTYRSVYVSPLLALTEYDVQLAYQLAYGTDGTILTQWRDMGQVTTGDGVTSNAAALGGRIASEVLDALDNAVAQGEQLLASLNKTIADNKVLAQAIIQNAMHGTDLQGAINAATYIDGQPIGPIVTQQGITSADLVATMSLLAIKTADGGAVALQQTTIILDPVTGETIADRFSSISATAGANAAAITLEQLARQSAISAEASLRLALASQVATNSSDIVNNYNTLSTQNSTTASELHTLGSWMSGGTTAFLINTGQTYLDGTTSLATYTAGVTASLGANSAAIGAETTARTSAVSAEAAARLALASTVGGQTSSISFILDTLNGNQATAILAVNVAGHVTGYLANGAQGLFAIEMTRFALVDASNGVAPFSPVVYDSGTLFLNAFVQAQTIKARAIITDSIQIGQVTQLTPTSWNLGAGPGSGTRTLVASAAIDLTDEANTVARATWVMAQDGSHLHWGYEFILDGSTSSGWFVFNLAQGTVAVEWPLIGLGPGHHQVDLYISGDSQTAFAAGSLTFQGSMR